MKEKHEATSTVVARINQVNIVMIENGEKRIAIKPICEALGISYPRQFKKLKEDDFLNSVVALGATTGADEKTYQMATIPYMYIFGWLFTINPKNVAPEARDTVMRYKMECYQALYRHFTSQNEFLEEKQGLIEERINEVNRISKDFRNTREMLKEAKEALNEAKDFTFEKWRAGKGQTKIAFPEEGGRSC